MLYQLNFKPPNRHKQHTMLKEILMNILRERQQKASEHARKNALAIIDLNMGEGMPESETERFKTEAIIMPEGFALIMLPGFMGVPPIPIEYEILKQMYEVATAGITKNSTNAVVDGEKSDHYNKTLERYVANGWPHPHVSGIYTLPSGAQASIVRPSNAMIIYSKDDSAAVSLSSDDVLRLSGIHSPSVLPDGPYGCPVPKEEEAEAFKFNALVVLNEDGKYGVCGLEFEPSALAHAKECSKVVFTTDLNTPVPEGKRAIYGAHAGKKYGVLTTFISPFDLDLTKEEVQQAYGIGNALDETVYGVAFIDKK